LGKEGSVVSDGNPQDSPRSPNGANQAVARASVEEAEREELEILAKADDGPRPEGWRLSPRAVRSFIVGDDKLRVRRKFYGDDQLVERAIVTLMGNQGLMLVGEPGTAKSYLSELLAAAVSGDSGLTVQGSAGTTEDQVKYSWNYALLLAEGPNERSLVPSPVYSAMSEGKIARFEELTRCAQEIQDTLISIMSEKQLMIPEFGSSSRLHARKGFNVIATANLRDRGVHEISSALKRRFNFETVRPISDRKLETELVMSRLKEELGHQAEAVKVERELIELLVTVFQELRSGHTAEGTAIKTPEAPMSTAEAVNVAFAAALDARYLGSGKVGPEEIVRQLSGVALKDNVDDSRRVQGYFDTVAKERGRRDARWKAFYEASRDLWV
jgi:MoxR-like ATPase